MNRVNSIVKTILLIVYLIILTISILIMLDILIYSNEYVFGYEGSSWLYKNIYNYRTISGLNVLLSVLTLYLWKLEKYYLSLVLFSLNLVIYIFI